MGIVGNKLEKPISISNLRTLLVNSSWSQGDLCTSSTIAKWAKYKPVRHSSTAELTEAQRKSVNCGMVAPNIVGTAAVALNSPDDAIALSWVYNKPRGYNGGGAGAHEWYRMLDFNGYRHDAIYPPYIANNVTYNSVWGGSGSLVRNPYATTGNAGTIQYGDINSSITRPQKSSLALGNWYLGILITKANGTRYIKTTSNSISTSPLITLSVADMGQMRLTSSDTSLSYFLFLCDTKIEALQQFTTDPSRYYYPALCDDPSQLKGIISLTTGSGIERTVISLRGGSIISDPWPPTSSITPYIGYPTETGSRYLSIGSYYNLSFKVTLTDKTGSSHQIDTAFVKVKLIDSRQSTQDGKNFTGQVPPEIGTTSQYANPLKIYNASGAAISRIDVPANGSVDIIFTLPDNYYKMYSNGTIAPSVTTGQQIYPAVNLTYYGNTLTSIIVKVSN